MTASTKSTHWHILGAGAIGCLWAANWQQDHVKTTLIGRNTTAPQTMILERSQQQVHFIKQLSCAKQLHSTIDYLLITTKAHQTQQAFDAIKHLLTTHATVIVLQNGMAANHIQLAAGQKLFAATTTDGAHFKDYQTLIHAGEGITHVGGINTVTVNDKTLAAVIDKLPQKLCITPSHSIVQQLWKKLAVNCAINALGVKYCCSNGELIDHKHKRQELKELCEEISMVCAALGYQFDNLFNQVVDIAHLTHSNINSTLQDINKGKCTEINELNGYLCRAAGKRQIASPLNQALVDLVLRLEKRNRESSR